MFVTPPMYLWRAMVRHRSIVGLCLQVRMYTTKKGARDCEDASVSTAATLLVIFAYRRGSQ